MVSGYDIRLLVRDFWLRYPSGRYADFSLFLSARIKLPESEVFTIIFIISVLLGVTPL
jgi:hypothetical protein